MPVMRVKAEDYPTISAAITAIGNNNTGIIEYSTPQTINTNVTIPPNITLEPLNGAKLVKSGAGTIIFKGGLNAALVQVFETLGTDNFKTGVTFDVGSVKEVYPEWWSETGGVKEAVEAAKANMPIVLQQKTYDETSRIDIDGEKKNTCIRGFAGDRVSNNGTQIVLKFNDALFQIGAEGDEPPPHHWNSPDYTGPQGFMLENVAIKWSGSGGVPLAYTTGITPQYYGPNSCGVKDWRGGHVRLINVRFENLEHGMWGVQSDINYFLNVCVMYCKCGIYAGPRSDQFTIESLYALFCDQVIIIDQAYVRLINPQINGCGYHDLYPIEIKQTVDTLKPTIIQNPWFEKYTLGTNSYINAFIGVGVRTGYNDGSLPATSVPNVKIIKPFFLTYNQGSASGYVKYIVEIGKGIVDVDDINGYWSNLAYIASFVGTYSGNEAAVYIAGRSYLSSKLYINNGAGTPDVYACLHGQGGWFNYATSNEFTFRALPLDNQRDFSFHNNNMDKTIAFEFPYASGSVDGSNILCRFSKRFYVGYRTYINGTIDDNPTQGTWDDGDAFTFLDSGTTPVRFIGKYCTVSGTSGQLTGVTGTIAASSTTLTVNSATGLYVGAYILIAGVTGRKKIVVVNGTTITIDSAANTQATSAQVTYSTPKFKLFGELYGQDV